MDGGPLAGWAAWLVGAVLLMVLPLEAAELKEGVRYYYRMLGASHNAPFPLKTKSILILEGETRTRTTGMADSGFTEYPFCRGTVSYTMAENLMYFPRLVSGARVDPGKVNTGDILLPQVFAPEGCVWGESGREFGQTFVATGREMAGVSLQIPTAWGMFRVALHRGGLGGPQVGSSRPFAAGGLKWGWARWQAGQAPLAAGEVYALRFWREDAGVWKPFLHATGDAYARGHLFVDGRPRPESDLAVWIVEEQADLSRALLPDADDDGWHYQTSQFRFMPRTPNVRLISIQASPVTTRCRVAVLTVWPETGTGQAAWREEGAKPLAGAKTCVSCGSPGQAHEAHFLFSEKELKVEPGQVYVGRLHWLPFEEGRMAEGEGESLAMDVQARVYGEPHPGHLPAIYNFSTAFSEQGDLTLDWEVTHPSPVIVRVERLSPHEEQMFRVEAGVSRLFVPKLWRGHDYRFELGATGPSGLEWKTPVYQMRVPFGPHGPGPANPYPEHPDCFEPIAPLRRGSPHAAQQTLRFEKELALVNPDFEEGLIGWTVADTGPVRADGETNSVSPPFGRLMAGWTHRAGQHRTDVKEESRLYQSVATVPGHRYLLSARIMAGEEGGEPGNARVRLWARPESGPIEEASGSSQWYWTDGDWRRVEHRWMATEARSRVGVAFFRWRDLDLSQAYVDHIKLLDLGPVVRAPQDASSTGAGLNRPVLALQAERDESKDRSEAFAEAPAGYVITGLGARAAGDNVTTMRLRIQPLLDSGELGAPEEIWTGWEPEAGLEANIDLPPGYLATGFGARIAPEWDVKTLAVWARPLKADGILGEEREFRAGVEPDQGLEKKVRLEEGRVLTGAGLRCSLNDVAGLRATSARLGPTATGRGQRSENRGR